MKANIEIFQFKFDSWIKFSKVPLNKGGIEGDVHLFYRINNGLPS